MGWRLRRHAGSCGAGKPRLVRDKGVKQSCGLVQPPLCDLGPRYQQGRARSPILRCRGDPWAEAGRGGDGDRPTCLHHGGAVHRAHRTVTDALLCWMEREGVSGVQGQQARGTHTGLRTLTPRVRCTRTPTHLELNTRIPAPGPQHTWTPTYLDHNTQTPTHLELNTWTPTPRLPHSNPNKPILQHTRTPIHPDPNTQASTHTRTPTPRPQHAPHPFPGGDTLPHSPVIFLPECLSQNPGEASPDF